MSMRLDEYDDKLTRLNDALERKRDSDSDSDLIVSPEVKLGVEKVRRWEERAATRLAESRGRSEEAMRQAETLRRSAASLPEDDDSDAESGTLAGRLRDRRESLRETIARVSALDERVGEDLVSLRATILRVMRTIVEEDRDAYIGGVFGGASREGRRRVPRGERHRGEASGARKDGTHRRVRERRR